MLGNRTKPRRTPLIPIKPVCHFRPCLAARRSSFLPCTAQRLYMYRGEAIRFRVTHLEWQEIEPEAPNIRDKPRELDPETGMPKELTREEIQQKETQREQEAGLRIIVSSSLFDLSPSLI